MKAFKSLLVLALTLFSLTAIADDFSLTINNDTDDSFSLTARPPRTLDSLEPHEQNKSYALGFMPNRVAPEFALLLRSNSLENASVIYQYPSIYCNPQTTYYRCSFTHVTSNSATVTLTKR